MLNNAEAIQQIRQRIRVEYPSQKAAAKSLGIRYGTLNSMLTGQRSIDERLCKWMGWEKVRQIAYKEIIQSRQK